MIDDSAGRFLGVIVVATGKSLDDQTKEKIKTLLAMGKAKNAVAKEVGVSWASVDKISKEAPDEIESLREKKKEEFADMLWQNIIEAAELGHKMVREAREGKRDIPLSHVSTYIGTLYDKRALILGKSTSNINVNLESVLEQL